MKKFCLVILLFFALQLSTFAKTGISFIYVNGSNIYDAKINKWYINGVQKFHPRIKKAFEQNHMARQCFLKNGEYFIKKDPVTFFWGDRCYDSTTNQGENSYCPKLPVNCLACYIRSTVVNVLHDIVWIQKHHNITCTLDNLNETIKQEAQKCNKIVLYGYSSGSLITYEYLLQRTPYINVEELFNALNVSKEQREFISQHPMKNTCMSALEQNLVTFSADKHIILDSNFNLFKKNYMNLDAETESVCMPDNTVLGMINIASPLVLFYSDLSDPNFEMTYYNRLLYKYILENNMFWLTVNYREDPLSFPSRKNLTTEEIENITNLYIAPHCGFIYDKSNTKGGICAISHMAYLSTRKTLAKSIVKAYLEGCRHQCSRCRQINRCPKNCNLLP